MNLKYIIPLFLGLFILGTMLPGCNSDPRPNSKIINPYTPVNIKLTLWNKGDTRKAIESFVKKVSDPTSPDFVPESRRIAALDVAGTLICEKPAFTHLQYHYFHLRQLANKFPKLKEEQPYKAFLEKDVSVLNQLSVEDVYLAFNRLHLGMPDFQYTQNLELFLQEERHPYFNVSYGKLFFEPMKQLIDYLHAHNFKVYLISSADQAFIRTFAERLFNVPPNRIIGSSVNYHLDYISGRMEMLRSDQTERFCIGPEKAKAFYQQTGFPPILSIGNTDGELPLLNFTESNFYPSLCLVINHDDEKREFAYNSGSEIILGKALTNHWPVISMKNDFKKIFPFQEDQ